MIGLALAYLRDRSLTTGLNILLLALAVATLVILLLFSSQIGSRLDRDARGIDLVVGAKGSPLQLILSSIYHVDVPTGNIPLESLNLLRNDPAVKQAIPLALGDNFRGFRIVGTEPAYAALYGGELAQGVMFARTQQAVIGADVAKATGMTIGQRFVGTHGLEMDESATEHEHAPFEAVGILKPTGTVLDRLILVNVESVWDAHGIAHDGHDHAGKKGDVHNHDHDHAGHSTDAAAASVAPGTNAALTARGEMKPEITALLIQYRSLAGAVRLPAMINRQTEMQSAVPATETARLLSLLGVGIEGAQLFAWLLALTGGLSIFVALLNAASAREGELALLRVMGATRASIFGTILAEGLIIAIIGSLIGLAIGHGMLWLAVNSFTPLAELGLSPWLFHPGEAAIIGGVLLIGVVAALVPAMRIFRTDLARVLARAQ